MEFMSVWMREDIKGSFTAPAVMVIATESYNKPGLTGDIPALLDRTVPSREMN